MPSRDAVVNVIGVDRGTGAMLKKLQLDAEKTGAGLGNAIDKGSSKAGSALNKLSNLAGNFGLPFAASLSMIGDKFAEAETKGKKFQSVISEVGKVALLGAAGGLAAFGGEAVKLGSQLQDSQRQMDTAITAAGQSLTKWAGPIKAAQQKFESLGFTMSEFDDALGKSVISTQDTGKSLGLMSVAADLARVHHIGLSDAINIVDRAITGNLRGLKSLGIDLPVAATSAEKLKIANESLASAQSAVNAILAKVPDAANPASAAHGIYETALNKVSSAQGKVNDQSAAAGQIMDALSSRLKGQAADAAQTFAGKMLVLKAQMTDLGAQVGTFLIPKIEALIGWIEKNKGTVKDLAEAIGVILGGSIVVFVAEKVAKFVSGIKSMVSAVRSLATKFAETRSKVLAEQVLISNGNAGLLASFRATAAGAASAFGPVLLGLAAVAAGYKLWQDLKDNSGKVSVKGTGDVGTAISEYNNSAIGALSGKNSAAVKAAAQQEVAAFNKPSAGISGGALAGLGLGGHLVDNIDAYNKAHLTPTPIHIPPGGGGGGGGGSAAASAHAKALAAAAAAAKLLQTQTDKLTASTRTLISDGLNKAKTALGSAQTAFGSFASSVSSSLTSGFSFANADSALQGADVGTTFIQELQGQADKTTLFTDRVRDLMSAGLSKGAIQQVLSAGTDAGTDIANQLLAGGADAINTANTLTAAVQNQADALGTSSAAHFYGAGVAQAQSIVDGITQESKRLAPKLKAASKKIAEHLKTQVEIDLKIISQGGTIPKLASGGIVTSPTLALIGEAGPEAVIPLRGNSSASTGGGDTYDITVYGANMTPQELVNALRVAIQRNGSLKSQGIT